MIKVQQLLIKVPSRTYEKISRSIIAKFIFMVKYGNARSLQNSSFEIQTIFFSYPGPVITTSLLVIFGISET